MKIDRQVIYVSYGRLKIYSDAKEITVENVVDEVSKAYALHVQNRSDIKTLWEYYRGKTKNPHQDQRNTRGNQSQDR